MDAKEWLEVLGVSGAAGAAGGFLKDYVMSRLHRKDNRADREEAANEQHRLTLLARYQELMSADARLLSQGDLVVASMLAQQGWVKTLHVARLQASYGDEQKRHLADVQEKFASASGAVQAARTAYLGLEVAASGQADAVLLIESDKAYSQQVDDLRTQRPRVPDVVSSELASQVEGYQQAVIEHRRRVATLTERLRGRFSPMEWNASNAPALPAAPAPRKGLRAAIAGLLPGGAKGPAQ